MFWLMKKLFGLGVMAALVFFALQFQVGGRPVKDYIIDFYRAPLVQEAIRQGTEAVTRYLQKDVGGDSGASGPPLEKIREDEVKELEKLLKKALPD